MILQVEETWQEPNQTSLTLKSCLGGFCYFSGVYLGASAQGSQLVLSPGCHLGSARWMPLVAAKLTPCPAQGPRPARGAQSRRFHHCVWKNHLPKVQNQNTDEIVREWGLLVFGLLECRVARNTEVVADIFLPISGQREGDQVARSMLSTFV